MSRERELLGVALDFLDIRRWLDPADQQVLNILSRNIEELLAQPEQKQEPVAWICNLLGDILTDRPADSNGYTPLYLAHPKRDPLSDDEVIVPGWMTSHERQAFEMGVRFAEKMHGIGGGE
jgi:hypothetical protein